MVAFPGNGYEKDEPPVKHVPFTAKQPEVMFHPTFEVEVADPEIVRPVSVVVPKPSPATERNLSAFEEDATSKTGFDCPPVA